MSKLTSNTIAKVGLVVHNIEDVVERYAKLFDIPAPEIHYPDPNRPAAPGAYKRLRGEEYKILLKWAHIDLNPLYLEVLEPYDETPSPWKEHLDKFGNSVCFFSFYINGFRQEIDLMEKQGYPMFFEEEKGHERYAYFETLEKLGITIELKERDQDKK